MEFKKTENMEITIKCTVEEFRNLLNLMHLHKVPCIIDELHEDFDENPDEQKPGPVQEPEPGSIPDPRPASEPPKIPEPSIFRKKNRRKTRPIDVRIDKELITFPSSTAAAKHLGCLPSQVSSSAANGWKCRGFEVRFTPDEKDEEILPR